VTNAVLDSRTMSGFNGGRFLVWNVTGNVKFRVTRLAGLNAVVSAVFFDAAAGGGNIPPTASITNPTEGASFTAPANLTIAAAAADTDGSVTLVEFFANGALIGSDNSLPYSFNWTNVNQGAYALTARATDDDGAQTTSAPVNIVVNPPGGGNVPPTTAITSPTEGASFTAPASISITADAADSDGSVTLVEFFANGTPIGSDNSQPYTLNWSNVGQGTYALTARATDDDGAQTTSNPVNVVVNPPGGGGATAVFLTADSTTQGNWIGAYGGQGYAIVGDQTSLPAYATLSTTNALSYTWHGNPGEVRALRRASGVGRVAATWYETSTTFDLNVNLTDGQPHEVALYGLDWDTSSRSQRVDVLDAGTNAVLDSRTMTSFNGGRYLVWVVTGNVKFRVTRLGGLNAVISAVFFDAAAGGGNLPPTASITAPTEGATFTAPANISIVSNAADSDGNVTLVEFFANGALIGSDNSLPYTFDWTNVNQGTYALTARATDDDGAQTTSAPVNVTVNPPGGGGASAVFVGADNTTQGNWVGTYGDQGYSIVGDTTSLPGYASLTTTNALTYTWHGNPGETRALQRVGGGRVAATWYEIGTVFDLNLNLADGQPHEVALYALDWDTTARSERIDVLDAATNAVLDTRTVTGFSGGRYLVWTVTGNVKFRVTRLGGLNGVISAVFIGSTPVPADWPEPFVPER
jgi:hypothetical protein